MIIAGVDLSLTRTGVAIVDTDDVLAIETTSILSDGHAGASWGDRHERLIRIRDSVFIATHDADLVVIEAPSLGGKGVGSMFDRSGLWWLVYEDLSAGPVLPVPPKCRAKYATGKGNAGKDEVVIAVTRRYPQASPANNDESDALILAAIGARLSGCPIEDSLPKTHLDALAKVNLPRQLSGASGRPGPPVAAALDDSDD